MAEHVFYDGFKLVGHTIEQSCCDVMPKIFIINESGIAQNYDLDNDTILIGRSKDNDIQIEDRFVSRQHLKINRKGNRYFVKDLKSTNGTFVNGKQLTSGLACEINEGVPIVIGMSVVCVGEKVSNEVLTMLRSTEISQEQIHETYSLTQDRPLTFRNNMQLINKVSNILSQPLHIDNILDNVADCVLDFFHRIDKSAIILTDKETGTVSKVIVKCQDEREDASKWYSQDVVEQVLQDGNAVMIPNTDVDDEYHLSDTLKMSKIGSVMCIPLISGTQIGGVVYVDSVDGVSGFRKEDLSLFTSLSAAITMTVTDRLNG